MVINIDLRSRIPIYEQLIGEVKRMAVTGLAEANEKMPSVRQLAGELGINPNTIQKAYTELERSGVIYTVSGKGSFISANTELVADEHRKKVAAELYAKIAEAYECGISKEELSAKIELIYKGGKSE